MWTLHGQQPHVLINFSNPPIFDTENANGSSLEKVIVVVDVYHIYESKTGSKTKQSSIAK
jgi:hypothetical protein